MNKRKDFPAIYFTVFRRCLLVVLLFFLFFFLLYCITTVTPFIKSLRSGRVLDQSQKKCRFFAEIKVCCKFFQLQPKRETSFSSLRDRLEKSVIISPSNWTIWAGLRGTSGFLPVPMNAVTLTNWMNEIYKLGATGSRSQSICELTVPTQPVMWMMWWVKVVHNTGVYVPYSSRTVVWVLLRPTRTR